MHRERDVEKYLKTAIQRRGGLCLKWVSPGNDGVPDRIIIVAGFIVFAELKTETGQPSMVQLYQLGQLGKAGAICCIIYGKSGADAFLHDLDDQKLRRFEYR